MNVSSFVFAHSLKARLRRAAAVYFKHMGFVVTGQIDAGATLARVVIFVSEDFDEVIGDPPQVWCKEPWMRNDADWHNDSLHGMCWVLAREWSDVLAKADRLPRDIVRIARTWLLTNLRSLVSRHHYAHLVQLEHWPAEWAAWRHYQEGNEEYDRERIDEEFRAAG